VCGVHRVRTISATTQNHTPTSARAELDSHADTCCFGPNAFIVHDTEQTISVEPFDKTLGTINNVKIVTAAVAYDCPATYQTYVLFFPQSLYFPTLQKHLLCPNQMRMNDVVVNDVPLIHLQPEQRHYHSHSIVAPTLTYETLHIPLELEGTTSSFLTRKPTLQEVQDSDNYTHVYMTSEALWDPFNDALASSEENIRRSLDPPPEPSARGRILAPLSINAIHSRGRPSAALDVDSFAPALQEISMKPMPRTMSAVATLPRHYVSAISTDPTARRSKITPEQLAARWNIGVETARKTLKATTQRAVRDLTEATGTRRLKPYASQLRYRRLNAEMYCDSLKGPCKSLRGNAYAITYATEYHWSTIFPIEREKDAHQTVTDLFRRYGVPKSMRPDYAKVLVEGEFARKVRRQECHLHPAEPHTKNQEKSEATTRELKREYRKIMIKTNTPSCLWDCCYEYIAMKRNNTSLNIRELDGEVPETKLTGDTSDISHIAEFGWFDWVWTLSPKEPKKLCRYCGPSMDVGDIITSRCLTEKGTFLHRTSVFPLSPEEERMESVKEMKQAFMDKLKSKLTKEKFKPMEDDPEDPVMAPEATYSPYEPVDPSDPKPLPELEEADDWTDELVDKYVNARVFIAQGDQKHYGTVVSRKRNSEGQPVGRSHNNPLQDTAVYEVAFDTGEIEEYTANKIAEAIYAKIDDEGYTHFVLKDISDHRCDNSAVRQNETGRRLKTTRGWQLCVEWNDGTSSWESLKDLKESNPLEVAQYASANQLLEEPAFAWWVPQVIRRSNRIIKAMKTRYLRRNQKYGIEMPKDVKRALEIDAETGTTFWRDAIAKEMKAVGKAFEILEEHEPTPVGHTHIKCHMVFDIKPDFTRKARLVAGGHMTDPPQSITYASVVSRESVRLAFLIAALNDLDVMAADIGNAYLNAETKEKIYTTCGPEFGPIHQGKRAKIVRALYGLKGSGAAWRSLISQVIHDELGFKPCRADNDVWMRPSTKPNGEKYYEYILVYTDDILCVSTNPKELLGFIDQNFLLKKGSIGEPTQYLGASVSKYTVWDDEGKEVVCWSMSSKQYVKEAIKNVERTLDKDNKKLRPNTKSVLPVTYCPELDATPLLESELVQRYQEHIGVLRWAVELGRIDICGETSMMASYCAAPRIGHLEAVYHMFAYLKHHENSRLVFNPDYAKHKPSEQADWSEFYRDAKEQIPLDMPEPRGKEIQTTCFVDSDHAGDKVTRRSRTGVLIFANRAPIVWYSKKQTSIETSSFGSEFSAMKTAVELVEGLRYKLRMMGVPLDGHTHVLADNQSVVKNSSIPESTLKKKSNSIAYHYVRERAAAGVIHIQYENTKTNLADCLTKIQPGHVRKELVKNFLFK